MIRIVILAYNEEFGLPGLAEALDGVLRGGESYRILVVDDGSRDKTAEVARELAKRYPVDLLQHAVNRGVAAAFETGIRAAVAASGPDDLVFTIEGDLTNDPRIIRRMAGRLRDGLDVVCASRYEPGGAYVGFPLKRRLLSWGANLLARNFFRVPGVKDYTLFYRGYRAAALKRALDAWGEDFIECRGFAANAEILVKVAAAGPLSCGEVATVYRYDLKRGKSSMKVGRNLAEYAGLFWRTLIRGGPKKT